MLKKAIALTIATLMIIAANMPVTVHAEINPDVPEKCTDGQEHTLTEWTEIGHTGMASAPTIYPNVSYKPSTYTFELARLCTKCGNPVEITYEHRADYHPTCQRDGYSVYTDKDGNKSTIDIIEADPKYHWFGPPMTVGTTQEVSEDGTISEIKYIARVCAYCHEEKDRTEKVVKKTVPSTCEADGYEEVTDENDITTRTEIKAEGHSWSAWETSVNPSTDKEGEMTRTCAECKKTDTAAIPKLKKEETAKTNGAAEVKGAAEPADNKSVSGLLIKSGDKKIPATKIKATVKGKKKINLRKGKQTKIKVKKLPKNATDKVSFKSSNKKIVSVTRTGKLKAKKKGKATIIIKCGKAKAKIKVIVN